MIDYKQAGVDVAAGDELVKWLQDTQPKKLPHQDRLVSGIGGFASLFRVGFPEMEDPCLVTCTDGVGTKIKLASHFQDFSTVGQDLVAMCVNDMVCCGAQPLLFLDYYATGKLNLEEAKPFLDGVRRACIDSNCLLIGGETAEMPGVYAPGDFDCAGFSVGIVDRKKSLGSSRVKVGDRIVGIASSGFHSNGFSLLRKVFADDLEGHRKELLEPTALYTKVALAIAKEDMAQSIAHITGGGIDNLLRVLPKGVRAELKHWEWPDLFDEVMKRAELPREQMLKTLNCGLGLAVVCRPEHFDEVNRICAEQGHRSFDLGRVVDGPEDETSYFFTNE